MLTLIREQTSLVASTRSLNARKVANTPDRLAAWSKVPTIAPLRAPAFALAPLPNVANCQWGAVGLFAGGGGLDLGFVANGVGTHAAYDDSKAATASYNANVHQVSRIADLAKYTPEDRCDVMLAGAPCQGFSTSGRRFPADPRNALLMRVADIAIMALPKVLVVENVPAALSGVHRSHWIALEDRLRLAGYNVARLQMNGEESGVAQRRRRLFLLAWRGSGCVRLELPTVITPDLRSTLFGIPERSCHDPQRPSSDSLDARVAAVIGSGQKLCNVRVSERAVPTWSIPSVFGDTSSEEREVLVAVTRLRRRARKRSFGDGDPVPLTVIQEYLGRSPSANVERLVEAEYLRLIEGDVELRHTYNGKYRRLSWNEPSPTVDTHFGRPSLFLHPEEDRGLSVREAARIQGFPDAYALPESRRDGFDIIGNAVPPPMAARLAAFVREALLKVV